MSLHALITGSLFADAEQRTSAAGKAFAKVSLVLREGDVSTWVRLVAFGGVAEELAALRKGDAVSASGRLRVCAYMNKRGEPAASLELIVDRLLPLARQSKRGTTPQPAPAGPPDHHEDVQQ